MNNQEFDIHKATTALLYTTQRIDNFYIALKVLYFADRYHLEKYGRLISDNTYCKLNSGPVPSEVYDMVKYIRGDGKVEYPEWLKKFFKVTYTKIIPLKNPNMDYLSESDIECLDEAITQIEKLSGSQVKVLSHDEAFKNAKGRKISIFDLAKSLKDSELIISHIND